MKIYRYEVVSYWQIINTIPMEEGITLTKWGAEQLASRLRYEARMQGLAAKRYEVRKR